MDEFELDNMFDLESHIEHNDYDTPPWEELDEKDLKAMKASTEIVEDIE
jgi:hypothetical protein